LTRDIPAPRTDEPCPEDPERIAQMVEILNASPVYRLLHMRVVHAAGGRSRVELAVGEDHKNLYGTVHGGMLATLMDSACGVALGTRLQPGETMVTLDLRVNYLLPVRSGPLTAEGEIVHRGRNTGVAEASILDQAGRLVARGMSTHFVRKVDEP
jgi:uncharacterized protein (TIGR00369 family)